MINYEMLEDLLSVKGLFIPNKRIMVVCMIINQ